MTDLVSCAVELRHLVDVEFRYETMALARSAEQGGRMFGAGQATFSGERLAGSAQWANFPRLLPDGSTRPEATGAITTDDEATVLFRLGGNGYPVGGRALHVLTFEVDDDRYTWLNDIVAVGEGSVDPRGLLRMRYHECLGGSDPGF